MSRPTPLNGVRIIDLTQVLAGPFCTYQLALLGAEVIKIEPPGGEEIRRNGGIHDLCEESLGLTFCTQNGNKECVEIDLKDEAGIRNIMELAKTADIFIQNFRPGVAERLGLGEPAIRKQNSKIIYCSISAYGESGPIGGRAAYDHVVQAMSGIMSTTGFDENLPVKVGAPYIDYGTGLNAAFGILAALRERDRTDEGQTLDVTMLDTALILMSNNLVTTATTGNDLPKLGNEAASRSPSSGCYIASDGKLIALAANSERQFELLCEGVGHPEWMNDPRWSTPESRERNQAQLRELLVETFSLRSSYEWENSLEEVGVPASRVRTISEGVFEGQPAARGLLSIIPVGENNIPVQLPAIGFQLNGDSLRPTESPHKFGEDNKRWLRNYTETD